jgi:drug/metabolite transporter (DMT)-like permease
MDFVFKKKNYMILIAGLVIILLGITLMIGGGSEDPTQFSEEIFNFQRLTLAPILIVSGFVMGVFAIMYKSKK